MNAGSEELERLLAILSDIYEPSGEHFSAKNAISALFAEREAQVAALHAAMLTTCTECGGMGHHAYMSADGPSMYGCHRCGGAGRYPICEQVQQAVLDSATVAREHDARVRADGRNDAACAVERAAKQFESDEDPGFEHPVLYAVRAELAKLAEGGTT